MIELSNNPDVAVGHIYDTIKVSLKSGLFKLEHLEALAEMTTELAQRFKEETSE